MDFIGNPVQDRALGAMHFTTSAQYLMLPFPHTTNKYYRMVQNRMLISKAGRDYKVAVANAWRDQRGQCLAGPVWLSAVLVNPDRRHRDLDNFAGKALLDALKGLAYEDDSQVWRLHSEWARHSDGSLAVKPGGELSLAVRSM